MSRVFASSFLTLLISIAGCSSSGSSGKDCEGGKCDDPGSAADRACREACGSDSACVTECREGKALEHCEARREDALLSAQRAFTNDHIRWACADVEGVNTNGRDDRGQEYCEYYAIVQPPPAEEGGEVPSAVDVGRNTGSSTTGLSIELTEDQIFALEDEPTAVVGQCVFTSWHSDIDEPLPICDGGDCPEFALAETAQMPSWTDKRELGFAMTQDFAGMHISINSNGAAADLVEKCLGEPPSGDPENPDDPLHDNYIRGCMKAFSLFKTEWRRSDPSVCVVGARLNECGCGVDTDGDGVADITNATQISRAVIPRQPETDENGDPVIKLRGFRLGTWSGVDELPAGCGFVDTGDTSHTLVSCDLTASDLLGSANDAKGKCREKYGDNVVVHVPIPSGALVCNAPEDGQYADTCGQRPWEVGNEGEAPDPDPEPGQCCKICRTSKACGDTCIPQTSTCSAEPGCACNESDLPEGA